MADLVLIVVVFFGSMFAGAWFFQRNQVRNGCFQNGRGRKLLIDDFPVVAPQGYFLAELIILEIGGFNGYNYCISQWQMSFMCIEEVIYLKLSEGKDSIYFANSHHRKIGIYPPEDSHYGELIQRLADDEVIIAWVDDWGAKRGYYCTIKIQIYAYPPKQ